MSLVMRDALLSSMLAIAGVAVIYMQYFAPLAWQGLSIWAWLLLAAISVVFMLYAPTGKDLVSYLKASRTELRKVVWPKQPDVVWTTFVVGITVIVFSILVSMLDSLLVRVLSGLIG